MANSCLQQKSTALIACVLAMATTCWLRPCEGTKACGPCGKLQLPYPLSTSESCGHPFYRVTCTGKKKLVVNAMSGNYTVESLDPLSRSLVIATAPFLGESCVTEDSIAAHNFSLFPTSPLSIAPGNTILLLNATDMLRFSPLSCLPGGPCRRALSSVPQRSCRNLFCCSFVTDGRFFRYGFPVFGQESGYVSLLSLLDPPSTGSVDDARRTRFGMRLNWEVPTEPPCQTQAQCGANSTCLNAPAPLMPPGAPPGAMPPSLPLRICSCNHGYQWDPITGTCPKAPFCVRNSGSIECHKTVYAIGLTIGIACLIVLMALTIYTYRRRRRAQRARAKLVKERSMILATNSGGKSARLFSDKEMKRATNNFARDQVLGCGGFGEVFKGELDDKTEVNHRSLVRLIGCCVDSELPLLVYEYVPNGSLYDHLMANSGTLDWKMRLRIGLQSAEGLAYLHSAAYPPIYHRDVKSSNILLDKTMNARVADFGLSRLAEPDLTHVSTCAQGTLGYLDPEYYRNYQLTDKSDVYSFGVVLLELVTSQRAIDFMRSQDDVNLAVMVQIRKEEGKVNEVLDQELVKGASNEMLNSMRSVIDLALECLHENRLNRPPMKEVAETLQQIISSLEAAERADVESNNGYVYDV
ncbi:hypothetical protein GOP47_0022385 [Adiantum capillus-veneris]|uniref:Protein kinase domain-containing protein n=1 Tax=Adiantum capillus-veneris TaxID=13818 RepID=A0A9D4U7N2_ADICA|nr:hypothetical protein GOP47_0022385 [Adiantum capillus-veneris]